MPIEAFICPMVSITPADGLSRSSGTRVKYQCGDVSIRRTGQLRFGRTEDAILVIEADQTYLDTIAADTECRRIATADNIHDTLTQPQVDNIQAFLEARGIPADWLTVGETRRLVLRGLAGMFRFSQRMEGRYGASWKQRLVQRGITLNTQWQELPQVVKDELMNTATSFGWTVGEPQPTLTLRNILKSMGNRFQDTPTFIASFEI